MMVSLLRTTVPCISTTYYCVPGPSRCGTIWHYAQVLTDCNVERILEVIFEMNRPAEMPSG